MDGSLATVLTSVTPSDDLVSFRSWSHSRWKFSFSANLRRLVATKNVVEVDADFDVGKRS